MCALVTGVQTCALPISYLLLDVQEAFIASAMHTSNYPGGAQLSAVHRTAVAAHPSDIYFRSHRAASNRHPCPLTNTDKQDGSEERRVGQEGVSTSRSRWSPYH